MVVVPENTIRADLAVSRRELAYALAANSRECLRNGGFLERASPDLKSTRILRLRVANANEPIGGLKQPDDSDDVNRQLAESRSSFLPIDARTVAADSAAQAFNVRILPWRS